MEREQLFMRRPDLSDLPPCPALPPDYQLRVAEDSDAVGLAGVMASAFGPEWTESHVRARLLEPPDVVRTWLVLQGDQAAATASVRLLPEQYPGSGYVHWVGTHRSHRGKHLGALATWLVLHDFCEMGCHDAVLETDPPRLPAIRTYLKLGFRPEYRRPGQDAVWAEVLSRIASFDRDGGKMQPAIR